MSDKVKDIGMEYFKAIIRTNLDKTEQSVIDENIDAWFKKYSETKWTFAIKRIRMEIEPSTWKPNEKVKVTGICLGSVDRPKFVDGEIKGIKENEVRHCILRDNDIIQVGDKGTPDISYGHEYAIGCVSGETDDNVRWYKVDEDIAPEMLRSCDDDEIMKKLNKMVTPITSLEQGHVGIVKVEMCHKVKPLQDQPFFTSNESGINLRMLCSGQQYDGVMRYISFFINPQTFGMQNFRGMFDDSFYSELKNAEDDDKATQIIRDWIVPEGDLEIIAVGRVKVKDNEQHGRSYSMSPVYLMMTDTASFKMDEYVASQLESFDSDGVPEVTEEHRKAFLTQLATFPEGKANFDILMKLLHKHHNWSKNYMEEITNLLLDEKSIDEPTLGTIRLVEIPVDIITAVSLPEPTVDELQAYLHMKQDLTIEDMKDYGYDVSEDMLEQERKAMYGEPKYKEFELADMKVSELKLICEEMGLNVRGTKAELIQSILKKGE